MTSSSDPSAPLSRTDAKRLLIAATNDTFESLGFICIRKNKSGLWQRPFTLPENDMYQFAFFVTSLTTRARCFALLFAVDFKAGERPGPGRALRDVLALSTSEEQEELAAFNRSRRSWLESVESRFPGVPPSSWYFDSEEDVLEAAAWIVPRLPDLARRHAELAQEHLRLYPQLLRRGPVTDLAPPLGRE